MGNSYISKDYLLGALGIFSDAEHGDPHFLAGIETAREIAQQAPAYSIYDDGWIPGATPPSESGSYIIQTDRDKVCTAHYYEKHGWQGRFKGHIQLWRPLPEARR